MISKEYIQTFNTYVGEKNKNNTIIDVFDYIVLSKINGQYKQTKELIKKLSNKQYKQFISYIDDTNQIMYKNTFITMRLEE